MVQLQLLNYVLAKKDISVLLDNNINGDYFAEYSEEYQFIADHYTNYKNIPDTETFVEKFPEFELIEVTETERYLVDTIREEYLYSKSVPVIKHAAELLKSNANDASTYLMSEIDNLMPRYSIPAIDITKSDSRVEIFEDKSNNKDKWFIPTGFEELDDIIGGWQAGEEFGVIFARTGKGKSWVLVKMAEHAWVIGKNVGYISPEMSADRIGYRFDTLHNHYSNRAMLRGDQSCLPVDEYYAYIDELKQHKNKFLVSTPEDFNHRITVSKIRNYILINKLDMLAIDGITYVTDERYKRGDNKTTTLTNISEDLFSLTRELGIPILVVVQSNRGGIKEDSSATPDLEDIRDSDGIAHNATKVISLNRKEDSLIMEIKKNRDGVDGGKLTYLWNIDEGEFEWIPAEDDDASYEAKESRKEDIKKEYKETKNNKVVF